MTPAEKSQLIEKWAPVAQASQKKWGVPASITLAQAALESSDKKGNWGRSGLALTCNNYFGIKSRQGEDYKEYSTHEFKNGVEVTEHAKFRKFKSVEDSFDRHGELLATLARYGPAMKVAQDNNAFALQLQRCGYSTDPNYPKKLVALIEQWKLDRFDDDSKEAA